MKTSEINLKSKQIAKNTILLYFRQILTMLISIYTSRIILDALGVVDYGVYNVVGGVVTIFAFLNSSLAQATQRFIAFGIEKETIEKQRKTFSMLLNVHILIAILIFILCETIGLWFFYNKLVIPIDRLNSAFWVMQCSIISLLISVTQVPYNATIFGHEKMNAYAYISIIEVLLKLVIVFILKFCSSDKLLLYGLLVMIVQIIIAFIYRFYCKINFQNCNYRIYWSPNMFKQIFSFTSWSVIGNFTYTLNTQGVNFLINIFFGPVYNAAKGIATAVEAAISSFVCNFLGASIPQIIKSYAIGDIEYCFNLSYKSSKFGFYIFMIIALPLISIMTPVLSIWLVEVPPHTSIFCVCSLLFIQTNSLAGTLQNISQATGKVRNFQLLHSLTLILSLPTIYICYKFKAPVDTFLYVMIIDSFISFFVQLIAVHQILNEYSILNFIKKVTIPEISAFIIPFTASIICWHIEHTILTAIISFISVLIICLLSIWGIGMTKGERTWILNIMTKKIQAYTKK